MQLDISKCFKIVWHIIFADKTELGRALQMLDKSLLYSATTVTPKRSWLMSTTTLNVK